MHSPDLAIVVADALRLRAITLSGHFRGRVLYFADANLVVAFESIRAHGPGVVALEEHFAHAPQGRAFAERVQQLGVPGLELRLITFASGEWTTSVVPTAAPARTAIPASTAGALSMAAADAIVLNTRRVPRFRPVGERAMKIDGKPTNLVDMSIMGAQVVSTPPLRPNQKLRVVLPDEENSMLSVSALVAWSNFEMPASAPRPQYRAGLEFTDAAARAIEDFCKRHCSSEPLPLRRAGR
jgi:hypothetical protein